jgi:hypothetical protein
MEQIGISSSFLEAAKEMILHMGVFLTSILISYFGFITDSSSEEEL